jgi:predicted ester cyclase
MTPILDLVTNFYNELWNKKNLKVANEILHEQVNFRGSLGNIMIGREKVLEYVREVTTSLDGYTCEIQDLVVENDKAAAIVQFRGTHVQEFMGYDPTGITVQWLGTAFFNCRDGLLTKIWVLGDLKGLEADLAKNSDINRANSV